jgi:hypothetical protein
MHAALSQRGVIVSPTCVATPTSVHPPPPQTHTHTHAHSFALVLLILLGGFALKRPDIHPWWIWMYWASPITVSALLPAAGGGDGRGCVLDGVHLLGAGGGGGGAQARGPAARPTPSLKA